MIRFKDLLDKVRGYSPDADLELLRKAYVFSALEHKGQIRHSGEPIQLSIDARVQFIIREELQKVISDFTAKGAAGIVMDVHRRTGAGASTSPAPATGAGCPGPPSGRPGVCSGPSGATSIRSCESTGCSPGLL